MNANCFPNFFAVAPRIVLVDPLAALLGAAEGGLIEYAYADAVKLAGHSCPTVAGAYALTRRALQALWLEDELPQRGGVRVELAAPAEQGVGGVVGAVMGLLTGAAGSGGFAGLGGRHVRRGLLRHGVALPLECRFTRLDNGRAVDGAMQLARVPPASEMAALLPRCVDDAASAEEQAEFARLWQQRVRRLLLEHADDPEVFLVREAA